ncbi:MAG: Hpt domain-containing protein [Cyanobacteria bacterium P01_A01_bin.105]
MSKSFDWNQLHQLAGGDTAFEKELLEMFLNDAESSLSQLEDALASNSVEAVEELAHYIKGASANVGAVALSQAAGKLERQAKQRKIVQGPRTLSQLQSLCRDVKIAAMRR